MQAPISDDAAIRFSQRFYEALAKEETVATAVTRGRNGIRTLEDRSLQSELITPVLYSSGKAERIAFAAAKPAAPAGPGQAGRREMDIRDDRIVILLAAVAAIGAFVLQYRQGNPPAAPAP